MDERFIPTEQGSAPETQSSLNDSTDALFHRLDETFTAQQQAAKDAGRLPDPLYDDLYYIQKYLKDGYIEEDIYPNESAMNVLSMIRLKLGSRLQEADIKKVQRNPLFQELHDATQGQLKKLYSALPLAS